MSTPGSDARDPRGPFREALLVELSPVVERWRRTRLLQRSTLVFAAAAAVAFALRAGAERFVWDARWPWLLLVVLAAGAWEILRRRLARDVPALGTLAAEIERAHPELGGLLLTVAARADEPAAEPVGFLETQLWREAIARAGRRDWARVYSWDAQRIWGAAACGTGLLGLYAVAAGLVPRLPAVLPDPYGLAVEPGATEVERGEPLLVTARFGHRVPAGATLVVRQPGIPPVSVAMERRLGDPVYAGRTPALAAARAAYHVETPGRTSRPYEVTTFVRPEVDGIEATVSYGAGAPAKRLRDTRRIVVAEGGRVELVVRARGEAERGRLVLRTDGTRAGDDIPLARRADDAFVVALVPRASSTYDVRLADRRGRENRTPVAVEIEVRHDRAPAVKLTFPGRDVTPSPIEELSLEAIATDEAAVRAAGVSFGLEGDPKGTHEVRLPASGSRVRLAHVVALEDLGAKPGDLLTYHFWAEDEGPDGKPRRGRSSLYVAQVRGFEQRFREGAAPPPGDDEGGAEGQGGGPGPLAEQQREILNATWHLQGQAGAVRDATSPVSSDATSDARLQADLRLVAQAQEKVVARASEDLAVAPPSLGVAVGHMRVARDRLLAAAEAAAPGRPVPPLDRALAAERAALSALLRVRDADATVARGQPGRGQRSRDDGNPQVDALELRQKLRGYEGERQAQARDEAAREARQLTSRLRELARRQAAVTEALKERDTALRAARTQERDDARARLERLRREQRELAAELDDVRQRLQGQNDENDRENSGERSAQATAAQAAARQAAEALERGDEKAALAASLRAQRDVERVRDEVVEDGAAAFGEEVRALRAEVDRLVSTEDRISKRLADVRSGQAGPLSPELRAQQEGVAASIEKARALAEASEPTAPLLHRRLYDAVRTADRADAAGELGRAADAVTRADLPAARAAEQRGREGLAALARGVREGAKGVLGDEAGALRAAKAEVEALAAEVRGELAGDGQASIAGTGFRNFSDRLRDVEELVGDATLRARAAEVRDRARALRTDVNARQKAAGAPGGPGAGRADPDTAKRLAIDVLAPLERLRDGVTEALRRLGPDEAATPIDTDPVAPRYSDQVRRYYESLAKGVRR